MTTAMASLPTAAMAPALMTPGTPAANWFMLPRCTMTIEKCDGGIKLNCVCDDRVACNMLQNLCQMMAGGLCGCCAMQNGVCVCSCSFSMCNCTCENTENGVCITCTTGDAACCAILQACCDCLCCCLDNGCACCLTINGAPICCCTC